MSGKGIFSGVKFAEVDGQRWYCKLDLLDSIGVTDRWAATLPNGWEGETRKVIHQGGSFTAVSARAAWWYALNFGRYRNTIIQKMAKWMASKSGLDSGAVEVPIVESSSNPDAMPLDIYCRDRLVNISPEDIHSEGVKLSKRWREAGNPPLPKVPHHRWVKGVNGYPTTLLDEWLKEFQAR